MIFIDIHVVYLQHFIPAVGWIEASPRLLLAALGRIEYVVDKVAIVG